MSTTLPSRDALPHRIPEPVLPSVGTWWPALDRELKREILADLDAPVRSGTILHIRELCGLPPVPVPGRGVHLGPNDKAYIAAWQRAADFS
ncbi:hypothetical protein [Agromyces archimandritae]|uniref:Uncharacterized protein n=1 Tax=Agromyces archimandritae TaxID=2781962 RepID=A0A975FLD4_9MICO|nr:hypothetical protein [Agromyces archimandritae]QTX04016.1 hypothetical protein G127AT_11995 [Agromyces archimandritae]